MDIQLILRTNYPNTEWALTGFDYAGLEWFDESPKPTKAALEKQSADVEYKAAYDAVSAARHAAYVAPGGSDSVFMKYQRGEATEQQWLDAIEAINQANPYPMK